MLMLQVMHALNRAEAGFRLHVAGAFTDLRTLRYLQRMVPALGLQGCVHFEGEVADMPGWYADKGVLLSTTMYESFGMNIGEAMAVGAFPVVHDFPGADLLWPRECLFASVEEAVALIRAARPGLYRGWVAGEPWRPLVPRRPGNSASGAGSRVLLLRPVMRVGRGLSGPSLCGQAMTRGSVSAGGAVCLSIIGT